MQTGLNNWHSETNEDYDILGRDGKHTRPSLVVRVSLQHEARCVSRLPWFLTARDKTMYKALLKMATSRYNNVS